jgi:hypothetical protein
MRDRILAIAVIAAFAAIMPAFAQQASSPWILPPHPTETGKPPIYDPEFVAKGENDRLNGCTPGLQCRFQLLGVIQNNGAVELRATAFKW